MSKKLKIFLGISYLLILSIFLYFIFSKVELGRINDFSYYKEVQVNLESYISDNFYINLILFSMFCIVWIALLGFGSPLLIISGILFGKWAGTFVSVISISVGALLLYSIVNFFFKDLIYRLLEKKFSKYIDLFNKNEFYYFFIFRLSGGLGIPFPLQNILPVIFSMKKINFFFSSFLGFIPSVFIYNNIGFGLNKFIKETDSFSFVNLIFSKEIYTPLIIFLVFLLISLLIKKKFFNVRVK